MKTPHFLIVLFFVLTSQNLLAQTFVIPDTNFRACLLKKLPGILDTNQNLVISKADTLTGYLSCSGYGIRNIDGVQYFNSIIDINLSRNSITQIAQLPVNNTVTRLLLDDNLLTGLPDLSSIPALKTLSVRRNKLTSLPDLSVNTKITQLYVEYNQLTSLPNLYMLTQLWSLNIQSNNIAQLPILDSLKKLSELVAADNRLTQVQSLTNLDSLTLFDVSGNQLTQLPQVAVNNKIQTVHMENNAFSVLPDFSVFPGLNRAYLDDNYFTFSDLQALEYITGYDTLFPLTSQKPIQVGKNYNVQEQSAFHISAATDDSVSGVVYTWYFQGKEIQQSSVDQVKVFTDSTALSGYYYCTLTDQVFPNLTLRTDSFDITITACFSTQDLIIETSPKTCKNGGGTIKLSSTSPIPNGFVYKLTSADSSETFTSAEGYFPNLGETEYFLSGMVNTCKKQIGNKIVLQQEACDNVYITADGDGIDDFYYFDSTGQVVISDKFGNVVSQLTTPAKWGGMGRTRKVAPGLYFANVNDGEKLIKITVVY